MPLSKQSVAGSLFQTLTRLGTAIGYGVAAAIFANVKSQPSTRGYYANNAVEPFAAVFWFAAGFAFLGCLFVPFLRIGTQGHKGDMGRFNADVERGLSDSKDTVVADEKEEADAAKQIKEV